MKFVETVKSGFYFLPEMKFGDYIEPARCYYITGNLKGNKWIQFGVHNPKWVALMWTCIDVDMFINTIYHETNPIEFKL
jgi:hypothetical protein